MTTQTLIVPYHRVSPLHIPQRDMVLGEADCLVLRVTIVHTDDPSSLTLGLTGGVGGPACRLFIFTDSSRGGSDYGFSSGSSPSVLWAGTGDVSDSVGSFDFDIGSGAFSKFPLRCGWSIQLDWDSGAHAQMLAHGSLHFSRSAQMSTPPVFVMDDTTDPDVFVLA
jgi:hypothetical protein